MINFRGSSAKIITDILFKYIAWRDNPKLDVEVGLKKVYRDQQRDKHNTDPFCPQKFAPELHGVLFSDIVLIEHFGKLEKGLSKLIKWYGYEPDNTYQQLLRFKRSLSDFRKTNTSRTQIIRLRGIGKSKEYDLINRIRIDLNAVSATAAVVVIYVLPSDKFKREFNKKLNKKYTSIFRINGVSNVFPYFTYKETSSLDQFFESFNSLYKSLHAEISDLVLERIGAHLVSFNKVPRMELIKVSEDLFNKIPLNRNSYKPREQELDQFLSGLGVQSFLNPYFNKYLILHRIRRELRDVSFDNSDIGFLNSDHFRRKFPNYKKDNYELIIQGDLSSKLNSVMFLRTIELYLKNLHHEVIDLKRELIPEFSNKSSVSVRKLKKYVSKIGKLKVYSLNLDRMNFLQDKSRKDFFLRYISKRKLTRFRYYKGDVNNIIDDFEMKSSKLTERIEDSLTSIGDNFSNLTMFKNLVASRYLQISILIVSSISALLIIFGDSNIWNQIKNCLKYLMGF